MFPAVQLSRVSLILACFAAGVGTGAGGTWFLTRPAFSPGPQQDAAVVPRPVRTVSWFEAHPSEMKQKYAACNDNPGGAMTDPECENALAANDHLGLAEILKGAPE